jgi:histidine triad (HIT) family protein
VAKAIEKVVDCKRVGLSVIGLEVPHVHVHLIPLNGMQDAQFINKTKLEPAEFEQLAAQLNQAYKQQD